MKNAIIIIILTIVSNLLEYGYGQSSKCGLERFQCKDGQCIANELLCDGRADCNDASDETVAECTKPEITCPDYAFRCSYGGCVDGDATCNGIRDCVDNSDETLSRCRNKGINASATCSPNQFLCDNGQCIPESSLCDGTADCADKSDETFIQCGSITCPQLVFRCNYGACIDGDLKCNGAVDCADGSDEDPRICRDITVTSVPDTTSTTTSTTTVTTSTARTPSPRQPCIAPPQPKNGSWKLHKSQCASGEHCDVAEGVEMEPGTYLVYNCNPGYKIRGSADVVCGPRRVWLNIPVCTEIRCRPLQSASTDAVCSYEDEYVSCQSPVLPRTIATLTCRTSYRQDTGLLSRSTVKCNKTGQWNSEPIRCIPVCGLVPPQNTPLIVNGTQAQISQFPWHATLYRAEKPGDTKEFICGATIIQERLLVTAAHCVYNDGNKQLEDPSKFFIATGNIYRDYNTSLHNPLIVKKAEVKNMYVVCDYLGFEGNYAGDIAILEVTEPFIFTFLLLPICMDIFNDQIILESKVLGKVAGFGRTAVGTSSYILQSITVPYIPMNQCKTSSMPYETERYITLDKFCAGYTNGTSVCDGDSGGGLVFRRGNLWYLKGIVSVSLGTTTTGAGRICDSNSYSLYTRVSNHMSWIQEVMFQLELYRSYPSCQTTYSNLSHSASIKQVV